MKQTISTDQLMELTEEQKNKLRNIWKPKDRESVLYEDEGEGFYSERFGKKGTLPILSIGQMQEMLGSKYQVMINNCLNNQWTVKLIENEFAFEPVAEYMSDELVDVLWVALKEFILLYHD